MCDKITNKKVASEKFHGQVSAQALLHKDAVRVALNPEVLDPQI